jgi:hypothetical protein
VWSVERSSRENPSQFDAQKSRSTGNRELLCSQDLRNDNCGIFMLLLSHIEGFQRATYSGITCTVTINSSDYNHKSISKEIPCVFKDLIPLTMGTRRGVYDGRQELSL